MISLEAFWRALSRASRSVICWALSATLRAPQSPPMTLLAPLRIDAPVPRRFFCHSLR
jgi:hypothetical protein